MIFKIRSHTLAITLLSGFRSLSYTSEKIPLDLFPLGVDT